MRFFFNILCKFARTLWISQYRNKLLCAGVIASSEHDEVLSDLQLDVVVDIGANRGQFALCARRAFPKCKIYSFEPLQKPGRRFMKVFGGDQRVVLFNKAIGAKAGTMSMHVSRWDVSSSLLPIARLQEDNFPFSKEVRTETIQLCSLDEILSRSDLDGRSLLKMDVQGYEYEVLLGCQTLLPCFEFVYLEASFIELYTGQALASQIISYLFERRFELICVTNPTTGQSRKPIQADFLFRRSSVSD